MDKFETRLTLSVMLFSIFMAVSFDYLPIVFLARLLFYVSMAYFLATAPK